MNIRLQGNGGFGGISSLIWGSGLKSTQEKQQRQAECEGQVAFFEQQKENLKNRKCETLEEIAKKLEQFHSYEDQIAAVKAKYNSEQMWHVLDEAEEQGEKNAEAAEKLEPKTPEERREEAAKEAMGVEESGGMLEEMLDQVEELTEELTEELMSEVSEELTEEFVSEASEELTEELMPEASEELSEAAELTEEQLPGVVEAEELTAKAIEAAPQQLQKPEELSEAARLEQFFREYRGIDIKV